LYSDSPKDWFCVRESILYKKYENLEIQTKEIGNMRYVRTYMLNSNRCDGLQNLKKVSWDTKQWHKGKDKKIEFREPIVDDILKIQDLMSIFCILLIIF
jgi:hypothetical protein